MKIKSIKSIILLILMIIAFFSVSLGNYKPKHSIYRDDDLGTSALRSYLVDNYGIPISRLLISPFSLNDNLDSNFVVIIGSERSYTSAEISAYRNFVENGGTLVIFEDFGPAREIAKSMGITYYNGMLRESNPLITINRPTQFLIKDYTLSFITGGAKSLYLVVSEAAAINDLVGLEQGVTLPILATFPTAFIDVDNDNVMDADDLQITPATPIGLYKQVGDGILTVISDASIPLNMYHNRQVLINGQNFNIPNIQWTSLLFNALATMSNSPSIIFDESHQEMLWGSGSGLINNFISLWVGMLNSLDFVAILFSAVVVFAILINRSRWLILLGKLKGDKTVDREYNKLISNPTLAERTVSEQYILFQRMGNGFLHVANLELYNLIKQTGRADEFLEEIDNKYGNIAEISNVDQLIEINDTMRKYVREILMKWL